MAAGVKAGRGAAGSQGRLWDSRRSKATRDETWQVCGTVQMVEACPGREETAESWQFPERSNGTTCRIWGALKHFSVLIVCEGSEDRDVLGTRGTWVLRPRLPGTCFNTCCRARPLQLARALAMRTGMRAGDAHGGAREVAAVVAVAAVAAAGGGSERPLAPSEEEPPR